MAERITVCVLPLPAACSAPRTNEAAEALVAAAAEGVPESGLRTAVSTGAWLPLLAAELGRRWSLEGLGFLRDDLRTLAPAEAKLAATAVDVLLSKLEVGERPNDSRGLGAQWHYIISPADLSDIIARTAPQFEIDESEGEQWAFVGFLIALQLAATDASEANRELLFWCRPA